MIIEDKHGKVVAAALGLAILLVALVSFFTFVPSESVSWRVMPTGTPVPTDQFDVEADSIATVVENTQVSLNYDMVSGSDLSYTLTFDWGDASQSTAYSTEQASTEELGMIQYQASATGLHTYTEEGVYNAVVNIVPSDSNINIKTFKCTIAVAPGPINPDNNRPIITGMNTPLYAKRGDTFSLSAAFTDADIGDTHQGFWLIGAAGNEGLTPAVAGSVVEASGSGTLLYTTSFADPICFTYFTAYIVDQSGSIDALCVADPNIPGTPGISNGMLPTASMYVYVYGLNPVSTVKSTFDVAETVTVSTQYVNPWNLLPASDKSVEGTIDWGDGTVDPVVVSETNMMIPYYLGNIQGAHQYGDDGIYTVTVSLNCANGPLDSRSTQITVGDITPPATTVDLIAGTSGLNGWYTSDVTVTLSATDPDDTSSAIATEYRTNGGSWTAYPTTGIVLSTEGVNTIDFMSTDAAGNVEIQAGSVNVKIDKTAPSINGEPDRAANGNGWYKDDVTVTFTASDSGGSGLSSVSPDTTMSAEGADQSVMGWATDYAGNSASATVSGINIDKTAPKPGEIIPSSSLVPIGTPITFTDTLTTPDLSGVAEATWQWEDGAPSAGGIATSTITGSHTYSVPGVYTVTLSATDKAGNGVVVPTKFEYVVVYDPNCGFVTGGGWINSPAGAYAADPSLTGKATFGFVSKYKKGMTVPTGGTEFQFSAGNMYFTSTSYEWMVLAGAKAQYKGTGMINGADSCRFMLTAIDGQIKDGGGVDMFRIRIWDDAGLIYDNELDALDNANPTTVIAGGSIVIHK